jgi:hypothetical protein
MHEYSIYLKSKRVNTNNEVMEKVNLNEYLMRCYNNVP